jgi:hypothetical protein
MTGRVLNFFEFQEKYSTDAQQDSAASYSEFSTASDNFQTAFDDASYEGPQLGPKRPVSGGSEMTPAQPGESGAPAFNSTSSGIEAPEYTEGSEDGGLDPEANGDVSNPTFGNYSPDSSGNPEEDDEAEDDSEDDEDDSEDDEDDSEDDKDTKEKNESRFWNRRRSSMILESFDSFTMSEDPLSFLEEDPMSASSYSPEEQYSSEESSYSEPENWVKCKSCGSTKSIEAGHDPFAEENIENPSEWWQGQQFGMQCGCNM